MPDKNVLIGMNHDTNQALIEKSLKGDTKAFGLLVTTYQSLVYTVLVRMVKTPEIAEELAQDTFVKAYHSLASFRGDAKFSSWLYRIAYRKALDYLRKAKRNPMQEWEEGAAVLAVAPIQNALEQLEQKEREAIIRKSIEMLPETDAALVTWYYFDDLSVKEIAAITELSESNIKVKLHRSRAKLYEQLQQYVLPNLSKPHGKAI
ncbi:RNA polymerase sigma factor [Altibacter sp. HG106]|uniref:RNA polymerase sigma factor n=1 Tax=Altibacter sp. HG106 TaxID=3023937 RepID=UPI0023502572|nr:sigma-70 family RNA polymerase sigma factor [Altibacter sp. HG106]MDC7995738.1 sigma-70 family RNA polymerase sigma factor [Altibacter sp. HG106]